MSRLFQSSAAALFGLALLIGVSGASQAGTLAEPTGPVLLEISGAIAKTNGPGVARFDLEMLKALDKRSFETSTNWTKGKQTFEGVRGKALAEAVGASGTMAKAVALNDYRVEIPLEDFTSDKLIVAYQLNGAAMSVRDKGPLWVMYDFDSDGELRSERYMNRSIWQLRSLELR